MTLGFHFIFSAYGFWLPNDPRGLWSTTIRQFDLLKYGPATKIETTRSVAATPHDSIKRREAKKALHYPPVKFNGQQARAIANGSATVARNQNYAIHALAILPDHVHLLMCWDKTDIDRISAQFKARATAKQNSENLHPLADYPRTNGTFPSPWARNYWAPYIRGKEHMRAAIRYVDQNPIKAGFKRQYWKMTVPYDE